MTNKITIICLLFGFLISNAFAQTLVIKDYNPRNPDENDKTAILITINYYPDGLVKSFEESYFIEGKKNREVLRSFKVTRSGSTIKQEFLNYSVLKLAVYNLTGDSIFVTGPINEDGKIEIRHEQKKNTVDSIYNIYANNKIIGRFIFKNDMIYLEFNGKDDTTIIKYSVDNASGLPLITEERMGKIIPNIFEIKRINKKTIIIINDETTGFPLREYRIEGVRKHASPEIAIINYYLFAYDNGFLAIFPYIGGWPDIEAKSD